jgi:RNA polymerase sigma-70 factor (ECF subfamily)
MDEGALLRRAAAGDRHAFGLLVRSHQEGVYRWIRRLVRDEETARDLTQDTFLRAFQGLPSFRGDAAFGTWVRTIATNVVRSHVRRASAVQVVPLDPALPSPDLPPDAAAMQAAVRGALAAAVAALPPRQRQVVTLRIHRDLPYAEIARLTGCTENAAKVNFHHALKRLRRALAEDAAGRRASGPRDARGAASKETFA